MIEVKNKLYTQRLLAKSLRPSDFFRAVTYTQYEGLCPIPWWYKKIMGESSTVDLRRTEEEIFSAMKSNTRNEIKRAEKEGITFEYNYDYEAFVPYFNEFAQSKGLPERVDIHTLTKYDKTLITIARHPSFSQPLDMHATAVNTKDKEAMLLYSCSARLEDGVDRKMIGWGNRYTHYMEFLLLKSWGIERYEWNGIVTNPERKEVYNVSQFKLSFGSEPKAQVNLRTPLFVLLKDMQMIFHELGHLFD